MRYEDMPKGRNKDRCVRCGKRYNFADKALSKAKVPYDLLCLAEVTASGYMTHGNVKLCDECMAELLMWLDRKTENSSEIPNNCEPQTEEWHDDCNTCRWNDGACTIPCCDYEPKDEPQTDDLQDWKDRMWAEAIVTEPQTCSVNGRPYDCGNCEYFKCTADEPQTEVIMPKKCKGCDSASKIIEAYAKGFEDGAEAVKKMPQTEYERASEQREHDILYEPTYDLDNGSM